MRSARRAGKNELNLVLFLREDIVYSLLNIAKARVEKDSNDPSAFIHIKVDEKNKIIYCLEEYTRKGLLNNQIADAIKSLGYSKEVITADAAEQKSIAELKRDGIMRVRPAKKGPDSVVQGISFIQQYKLVVDDRCVKLIEELENYTYQKDKHTNEYINKPVDSYNHVIDAIRYAIEPLNGNGTPKGAIMQNNYI